MTLKKYKKQQKLLVKEPIIEIHVGDEAIRITELPNRI